MFGTKKLFFLVCLFLVQVALYAHPLHVSICQIFYNEENQNLEIYINVYADDLMSALSERGAPELFLGEDKEIPQTDSLINGYLQSKFSVFVDNEKTDLSFVGKEMDTDAVWSYYESKKIDEPEMIRVHCDILTDVFNTQNNIIQITKNDEMLSMIFDKRKTDDSIKWK